MRSDVILIKLFLRKKHAFLLLFMIYATTLILGTTALNYFQFVIGGQERILEHIVELDDGVVITSFAVSPFTSLVDPEVLEKRLQGIADITIDYYFITLGYVYGKPVVVVGSPSIKDDCAFVEASIYYETVEIGLTSIAILSPFTDETVFLRVCGKSGEPYILVSHTTAARLRGVPSRYYTIAIVKSGTQESLSKVLRSLNVEHASSGLVFKVIALLGKGDSNITGKLHTSLSEVYFARLGVNREYFTYFASAVLAILLIGLPLAGYGVLTYVERALRVLRSIGVSRFGLFKALCMYMALPMIPALLLGYSALDALPGIEILGFTLTMKPSVLDIALVCTFTYVLSIIGVAWGLRSELE